MILEWPHPQIDHDWAKGRHQWRAITPLAYRQLREDVSLLYNAENAFMQGEPVDILADGKGLYVCCQQANGYCFARLLPASDWQRRDLLSLPQPGKLPSRMGW